MTQSRVLSQVVLIEPLYGEVVNVIMDIHMHFLVEGMPMIHAVNSKLKETLETTSELLLLASGNAYDAHQRLDCRGVNIPFVVPLHCLDRCRTLYLYSCITPARLSRCECCPL